MAACDTFTYNNNAAYDIEKTKSKLKKRLQYNKIKIYSKRYLFRLLICLFIEYYSEYVFL